MGKSRAKEIPMTDFVNIVFVLVALGILSSILWGEPRNVSGYYQNLLITSFSIAPDILHIYEEIRENKERGYKTKRYIRNMYAVGRFLVAFCCAVPMVLFSMSSANKSLLNHITEDKYWGACLVTFLPVVYNVFLAYVFPEIKDIKYETQAINFIERPQQ